MFEAQHQLHHALKTLKAIEQLLESLSQRDQTKGASNPFNPTRERQNVGREEENRGSQRRLCDGE
jgi:hypothetical protein